MLRQYSGATRAILCSWTGFVQSLRSCVVHISSTCCRETAAVCKLWDQQQVLGDLADRHHVQFLHALIAVLAVTASFQLFGAIVVFTTVLTNREGALRMRRGVFLVSRLDFLLLHTLILGRPVSWDSRFASFPSTWPASSDCSPQVFRSSKRTPRDVVEFRSGCQQTLPPGIKLGYKRIWKQVANRRMVFGFRYWPAKKDLVVSSILAWLV